MLKLKMMLCVMMLPLVVVSFAASKQSVSQLLKPPPPPAWMASRLAGTAEQDYFTLRERLITMQNKLEGTQKYINEQCRWVISMGNSCNYCEQYTRASSGV